MRFSCNVNVGLQANTGKLSLRELKHSNLFQEFMHVDEETDINLIREYFSYEHFYVLYCRFFELDADKDAKIGKEDLMKYADRALSQEIVDRLVCILIVFTAMFVCAFCFAAWRFVLVMLSFWF